MRSYHCESDVTSAEIKAALADGTLTFWRFDTFGRRWFRAATPIIRGVPKHSAGASAESDDRILGVPRTASAEYAAIVLARARGENIPAAMGTATLVAAGKSLDEFNADVAEAAEVLWELGEL